MPSAAVKFPSEPPPTVHSPKEKFICFARDLARTNSDALILRSSGGLSQPPVISRRAPRTTARRASIQAAHVGNAKRTQIENGALAFRDNIRVRAPLDDAGVDGDTAAKIIPSCDARELPRQFVNGVDTFLRCETRVGSAAMHNQFGFADPLAGRLQQAARAEGRLKDEDGITAARFRFE